jgi:BON domain
MRCVLCGLLLVLVAAASAQQQQPPYNRHGTPPTFPQGQPPGQDMPPDTAAPPPQQMSSWQVQQQIQDKLNSEPSLANANVKASVSDSAVILTGVVDSERQHQLVLRIAQSYAGDREILDRIQVQGQT